MVDPWRGMRFSIIQEMGQFIRWKTCREDRGAGSVSISITGKENTVHVELSTRSRSGSAC